MKQVVLVVPAYNEEEALDGFFTAVTAVLDGMPDYSFRIILVNDGSKDGTLEKALAWRERDERIAVLDLSRNFGHEAALSAGLSAAGSLSCAAAGDSCDAVIVMDADLQDPPSLIGQMLAKYEEGYDVVNACRNKRKADTLLKRFTAKGFYRTINALAGKVKIPENVGNFRLISRRVLDILNSLPEKNRVFRVLIPYLGFSTAEVDYERPARTAGRTHYSYTAMFRLAIDGITSATIIPLKFAVNTGFIVSGLGFLYLVIIIAQTLFTNTTVEGWASTMSVILFLGGIQLIFLGILGEYIGRIFLEVKNRPEHLIRQTWNAGKK